MVRTWTPEQLTGIPCLVWRGASSLLLLEPVGDGVFDLRELDVDGTGHLPKEHLSQQVRVWPARPVESCTAALSPDSRWLAVRLRGNDVDTLILLSLQKRGLPLVLAEGPPGEGLAWSPDGKYLAFGLGETLWLTDRAAHVLATKEVTGILWAVSWLDHTSLWAVVSVDGVSELVHWSVLNGMLILQAK